MGIWGKPDVQKYITKKDINGLRKACEDNDYEIRKSAMLGLINLNELLPNSFFILTLINDPDKKVRDSVYNYSKTGKISLFASITALHDEDKLVRFKALNDLNKYHKNISSFIIKRSSEYDPDPIIRNLAYSYITSMESIPLEEKSFGNQILSPNSSWFSLDNLIIDFYHIIDNDEKLNNHCIVPEGHQNSILMQTCRARFKEICESISTNKIYAIKRLEILVIVALQGYNTICDKTPRREYLTILNHPFEDYLLSGYTLLAKLNYWFSKH